VGPESIRKRLYVIIYVLVISVERRCFSMDNDTNNPVDPVVDGAGDAPVADAPVGDAPMADDAAAPEADVPVEEPAADVPAAE
jgi:hypothetical protein